jgi:hypothetical protein
MRLATSSSSLLPNVTSDWRLSCERRAKPGARLKALPPQRFSNRREERETPADRQERSETAIFAGLFTGD